MTDYADIKVEPELRSILEFAATKHYGQEFRSISRSGHEAVIAWLLLVPDDDIVDKALDSHGYDGISELVEDLSTGRFDGDDQFDPLAAVRHPGGDDDA